MMVDLRSDTKTQPTAAMRAAMAAAQVGDEQQDEDPTVSALTARVARLLGKEQAIFLPTGTMANLIAILVHCQRGDEIFCDAASHVRNFETGGAPGIAGALLSPIASERGIFSAAAVERALREPRRNAPRPRMIWIEQTCNMGGGAIWPIATLREMKSFADDRRLAIHIDGARLMNASVACDLAPEAYGECAASLYLDFTKGLGAPFGAVLAGSASFIEDSRRYKHMLGGAMRQAGIMAAACLHSLDVHVERLRDDHRNARRLADGLRSIPGIEVDATVETNIVMVRLLGSAISAQRFVDGLARAGIKATAFGQARVRLVTHMDVTGEDVEFAIKATARMLSERSHA